ncbi:response regulator transcription factor [Streptomyces sp. NPDC014724]|uniref:response regulator transcription factor n=1 Tax=unclassified Streptomyces TaxID=2593676 RepID=UPI0036FC3E5B
MNRVLVVEDMQVVRVGLVALPDGESGIEVVGQAPDARAAPDTAKRSEPDVALLDIELPGTEPNTTC